MLRKVLALAYVLLCVAGVSLAGVWKKNEVESPINMQINLCLMACGVCFNTKASNPLLDAVMMECANELCLQDLTAGKPLKAVWKKECPELGKAWNKF